MLFQLLDVLRMIAIFFLIVLICIVLWVFIIVRIIRKIHPFPIPSFMTRIIDNKFRRKYLQNPNKIAERMKLEPGMKVVEIGPGKGNYTKTVANKILPNGIVYAIDISEEIIERLQKRIDEENIENIFPKVDNVYNFSFEDESVDRIFAITCLPEIPDQIKALKECFRILKPDGILSLCELFLDPDYPLRRTEKKWAKEARFTLKETFGNWFTYQLNFMKNTHESFPQYSE